MKRDELNDLAAFMVVAEEQSFTRAARKLLMSPSALSHAMKALEARLGVRLLARTTRSVATTEAGERLVASLRPALDMIDGGLADLRGSRDKPTGTVRITTFKHAATAVLWPALPAFLDDNPDVRVEVIIDDNLTDIVSSRFDAGIRWGDMVAKDMIAIRIGADIPAVVVASPAYLAHSVAPQRPEDLADHRCINYRTASGGGPIAWEFERRGKAFRLNVDGPLVFNDTDLVLAAALAGLGVAYMLEDQAMEHIAQGRLVRLLAEWCPIFPGFHLYHTSRRQMTPALAALIAALRLKLKS